MHKIFISGSMAYDEIMVFPHHFKDYFHPEKLHQINVSFVVDDLAKHLGGIATNISYSLRLTSDYMKDTGPWTLDSKKKSQVSKVKSLESELSISPVGAVGRDGGALLDFFKKNKIDTKYVLKDEKLYTATGKVITDMNDNQIWGFYYGAARLNPKLDSGPWTLESKKEFWIVSATHEKPFTNVLRHVMKKKLPYLFDPGMALTWIRDDLLKKGVLNATYVVGNDYEIAMIEKRLKMSVKEIVESGVNVITTLGEKGVRYESAIDSVADLLPASALPQTGNPRVSGIPLAPRHLSQAKTTQSILIKAVKIKKIVDPTGAGDAWRGGFVGALAANKPIEECLIMGNVMASFAVQAMGTVEYTVNKEEIKKRVKALTE